MGIRSSFLGHITIDPPLNAGEREYLSAFADSRRWDRPSGPYTVPSHPLADDYDVEGVTSSPSDAKGRWPGNEPPASQPGLWCDWTPCAKGCCLAHDDREEFYGAAAWLEHVIDHFLRPGAQDSTSGLECFSEPTFDQVCRGTIAMERGDVRELSLMHVERSGVTVEVLVAGEGSPW